MRVLSLLLILLAGLSSGSWVYADLPAPEDELLVHFRSIFAPEILESELSSDELAPVKCGTPLVREFQSLRNKLAPAAAAEILAYLQPLADASVISSPEGRFQLSFETTGPDAVPTADVDPANGVPDYVERIAAYLDEAWQAQFTAGKFELPISRGVQYPVSFRNMGAYGYTVVDDVESGATRLVLHCDYDGFPLNDDPEGDRWGAAKVTIAHELRHASQYAASRWSEGGWIELDAVWAEEWVFDEVNDYYQFLMGESPLRRPDLALDSGSTGTGSYEDAVFEIWLQENWGVAVVADFWQRRTGHLSESIPSTWAHVLADRDVDWPAAWAEFTGWNYATDQRSIAGMGYEEANSYPAGATQVLEVVEPVSVSAQVEPLAAQVYRLEGFLDERECCPDDRIELILTSTAAQAPLTLAVQITRRDGNGSLVTLSALEGDLRYCVDEAWQDIESIGVIVGNASLTEDSFEFELLAQRVALAQMAPWTLSATDLCAVATSGEMQYRNLGIAAAGIAALNYEVEIYSADPRLEALSPATAFVPWFDCSPRFGRLDPDGTVDLALEFDASELVVGTYRLWLSLRAEGYRHPDVVPIVLEVRSNRPPAPAARLRGSQPNPFNPVTWIHFELSSRSRVQIDVLDVRGRVVRRLANEFRTEGDHRVAWNGRDDSGAPLGAGVYLARLRTGAGTSTCKMILAK